jgi:hypothetical protein
MRTIALAFACAFALYVSVADADVMQSDGVSASLELPKAFCALGRTHPVDKQLYEMQDRMQASANGVVIFAVACDEVEGARKGQRLKRWALWLINGPVGKHSKIPDGMSREAVTEELSRQMPSIDVATITKEISTPAGKEGIAIALNDMRVIANDKAVMYTAQVANVEKGGIKRQLAVVTGWASMAGRLFTLNVYADLVDGKTFDALLAEARDAVTRSISSTDALTKPK